jgi:hypothetical protein
MDEHEWFTASRQNVPFRNADGPGFQTALVIVPAQEYHATSVFASRVLYLKKIRPS